MQKENSAETIYLLRHWQTADKSPRFLLEVVQATPQRRIFTNIADLTKHLITVLSTQPPTPEENLR